jgi:hypothetical protein
MMVSSSRNSLWLNLEHIEFGQRKFRLRVTFQPVREKLILAPFERHVDVAENAQEPVGLMLGELARNAGERPIVGDLGEEQLGVALAHGMGEPEDQLAGRRIGKMHALEIDDDVAGGFTELGDAPQQLLGRAEEQRPLRIDHGDLEAFDVKQVAFLRGA